MQIHLVMKTLSHIGLMVMCGAMHACLKFQGQYMQILGNNTIEGSIAKCQGEGDAATGQPGDFIPSILYSCCSFLFLFQAGKSGSRQEDSSAEDTTGRHEGGSHRGSSRPSKFLH